MRTITVTQDEAFDVDCENPGACIACGERAYGVEPDARGYVCDVCGESQVYGLEELAIMGNLAIVG